MPVYLDGLGSVTAYYTVTIHTRVDGELMSVEFREGDFVQKGQLLAEIDPRPFQAQLEQAQGQMARDMALLENARVDLARYETLVAQEAAPKQQLDTQRATVKQFEGTVKLDQAAIDTANLQLTYARITAPISGRVGLRLVDPGNIVHSSDANGLLVITQLQPIAVLFTIPEDSLPAVLKKLRSGVRLPVDAYNRDKSSKLASGRLLTTDNQIDPQTGTSRLKAEFGNRDNTLFPNQFVNVRLLVDTLHNQTIVPAVAIQRGQQGTFVYAIKPDNTVEVKTVQVGLMEGTDVTIVNGLNVGETVVTDGSDRLQSGVKVRIRPPSSMRPGNGSNVESSGPGGGPPA
jgi:membrane fusion protein, multidrug efflux system